MMANHTKCFSSAFVFKVDDGNLRKTEGNKPNAMHVNGSYTSINELSLLPVCFRGQKEKGAENVGRLKQDEQGWK